MKGFPLFSNFEDFVQAEFESRKGNPLKVSQFNVWVRMMSAVGDGLIMYHNPDHKLFKAAGDLNVSTIYGGQTTSGVLGVNWKGAPVYGSAAENPTVDVPLKPSPIVTSISVDEGTGNISRKASISITAFTQAQADLLAEYFLEPGFTVFFEFGWNNSDAMTGLIDVSSANVETIASTIANMQNFNSLIERRRKSKGKYDNYLGYITGGNVSVSGETWEISVELTGFNEIPYYMMNRDMIDAGGDDEDALITTAELYDKVETESDVFLRRFKIMFNDLPAKRRTKFVKELEGSVSIQDLINFDEDVIDEINKMDGKQVKLRGLDPSVGIRGTDRVRVPKNTKLVDSNRFISMRLAMKILELNAEGIELANGNEIKFNINIEDAIIKAFKNIFSTDKSKLLIPNSQTPSFSLGTILNEGELTLKVLTQNGNTMDNSFGNYKFPQDQPLYENVTHLYYEPTFTEAIGLGGRITPATQTADESDLGDVIKNEYEWGYLKHLYINFDFFKRTVDVQTFVLSDVLKTLLNGLSDAVSSYWDFQIFEREDDDGNMTLQIVDMEFTTKTEEDNVYEFPLMGERSIFSSNSFNMDIPGAMANKIIGERLGAAIQSTLNTTGLFTEKRDNVLQRLSTRTREVSQDNFENTNKSDAIDAGIDITNINEEQEVDQNTEELTIKTYLGNVGIYPNPILTKDVVNLDPRNRLQRVLAVEIQAGIAQRAGLLEDYIIYGTYNDTQLFDGIYNRRYERIVRNAEGKHSEEYSTLLPLKFSFTVQGITGIRRGDKFKVLGLPRIFTKNAFFQITSIKQSVSGNGWQTEVEGALRRAL